MRKSVIALAVIVVAGLAIVPVQAQSSRVRVGALTCNVAAGVGLIIGSNKSMSCTYQSVDGWSERYSGNIIIVGADIGFTDTKTIGWAVWAPVAQGGRGALAGG